MGQAPRVGLDSDVTPEHCARYNWLVGSRDTVGRRSMELLVKEVMPRFEDLVPK